MTTSTPVAQGHLAKYVDLLRQFADLFTLLADHLDESPDLVAQTADEVKVTFQHLAERQLGLGTRLDALDERLDGLRDGVEAGSEVIRSTHDLLHSSVADTPKVGGAGSADGSASPGGESA